MYSLFRSIIFQFSPETAHHITFTLLRVARWLGFIKWLGSHKKHPVSVDGITYKNRIGIAAGLDKNADYLHELAALGFAAVEIGTVTPKPQPGNPKPRLFRLKQDKAIINRMGFNNKGVDHAVKRLKNRPKALVVGGNIGKNKITPNADAVNDYLRCHQALYPYVDYFTINVSSPNTPGLRELQDKEPLMQLLSALRNQRGQMEDYKPHYLKIAPDITDGQIEDIADIVNSGVVDGLIANNTTIERKGLKTDTAAIEKIGNGGLSGAPVLERSNAILKAFRDRIPEKTIIGVGGICDRAGAQAKKAAGADLLQIYTGFVYGGPKLLKEIQDL